VLTPIVREIGPLMPGPVDPAELRGAIDGLESRIGALRQAGQVPGAELRLTLEAALVELDLAVDMLGKLAGQLDAVRGSKPQGPKSGDAERRLLRAVFLDAPAPIFLLEHDGTVRRINRQAGELLGTPPGYATGMPFTAFIDLQGRAAMRTHLHALVQTRRPRRVRCQLLSTNGRVDGILTIDLVQLAGEPDPLIVAIAGPAALPAAAAGRTKPRPHSASEAQAIVEATQRLDLVTATTRLLLENATFNESVTLQRCARLLSTELSSWVVVDVEEVDRLRRKLVVGPKRDRSTELTRTLEEIDPAPGSLPCEVHESGQSRLLAHAEDASILGADESGVPVLTLLGATSLLCVPLSDGQRSYGTMTLIRPADNGPLELADLGLVEELGEQLALAIKVDRLFMRRSEVVDSLQTSLLPRNIPPVPGMEIAHAYVAATEGLDVGGDFYDVYDTPGGWGLAIGDVQGKGEEAAAVTAMARHAIRVLAHWNPRPGEVLSMANEVMLAPPGTDRFVTAAAAHLRWEGDILHATVGSAGHPGPALIRADGRVRLLAGGGMPLGLFAEAEPATEEVELAPGDILFFFTDGVTEARSPENIYFEDRLVEHLAILAGQPAATVVSQMRDLVLEFSLNDLRDDMTMLALRVLDAPEGARQDAARGK
jgi:serine phosphatase RsbU (regulator of sigma subunit)/PAS domain-containing protein